MKTKIMEALQEFKDKGLKMKSALFLIILILVLVMAIPTAIIWITINILTHLWLPILIIFLLWFGYKSFKG